MDYIILTYPRCGSNYLQQLIKQKLRDPSNVNDPVEIPKTHLINEVKGKKIITIVRDPYQTMKSLVSLAMTFPESNKFKIESGGVFKFPADEYIEFYKYIIKNAELIINYNDLISKPDKVIQYLAKHMSLAVIDVEYINELVDYPDHLVSSKTSKVYDYLDYKNHLPGEFKMFECLNQYKQALDFSLSLS